MAFTLFETFLHYLSLYGLEYYKKYYGIYRGTVTNNQDPETRGRIQVIVPSVGHVASAPPNVWVDPAFEIAGPDRGSFFPPEVDDSVRVAFENGNPSKPVIYWGGWYGQGELPSELGYDSNGDPKMRGWVFRNGHVFVFNETAGSEQISLIWRAPSSQPSGDDSADRSSPGSSLIFEPDGSITLTNKDNSLIKLDVTNKQITWMDENSNLIQSTSSGITIQTNGNVTVQGTAIALNGQTVGICSNPDTPAVRGQDLMTWLSSHTHGTGVGPSTPPLVPPTPTILSEVTTLK
jgi:uncharacterized protein involved in type VI secretion and phage assembly